jgi:hypothetical protein
VTKQVVVVRVVRIDVVSEVHIAVADVFAEPSRQLDRALVLNGTAEEAFHVDLADVPVVAQPQNVDPTSTGCDVRAVSAVRGSYNWSMTARPR